jgi:hypothetical protein
LTGASPPKRLVSNSNDFIRLLMFNIQLNRPLARQIACQVAKNNGSLKTAVQRQFPGNFHPTKAQNARKTWRLSAFA